MKRKIFVTLALIAGIAALVQGLRSGTKKMPPATAIIPVAQDPGKAGSPAPSVNLLPLAEEAARLNDPATTAEDDLGILDLMLGGYHRQYGQNPVGDNDEITAALTGHNPRELAWLPSTGNFLDKEGRLIDRWGTPYFFHAESGDHLQIRSAGSDRKMWTDDDVVQDQGR